MHDRGEGLQTCVFIPPGEPTSDLEIVQYGIIADATNGPGFEFTNVRVRAGPGGGRRPFNWEPAGPIRPTWSSMEPRREVVGHWARSLRPRRVTWLW